jgi:hypothetical protein
MFLPECPKVSKMDGWMAGLPVWTGTGIHLLRVRLLVAHVRVGASGSKLELETVDLEYFGYLQKKKALLPTVPSIAQRRIKKRSWVIFAARIQGHGPGRRRSGYPIG